jgi:hypothetical protein
VLNLQLIDTKTTKSLLTLIKQLKSEWMKTTPSLSTKSKILRGDVKLMLKELLILLLKRHALAEESLIDLANNPQRL